VRGGTAVPGAAGRAGRALAGGLLLLVGLATPLGAHAAEEVWTWDGPEGGLRAFTLTTGKAVVQLRVPGPDEEPGPALVLRYDSEFMDLVVPEPGDLVMPGTLPMLVAEINGDGLELVPRGDLPRREARLEIELRLHPRAAVALEAEDLEVLATGPWALPPPEPPEGEGQGGPRGRRARRAAGASPRTPPQRVIPPAPASLKVRSARAEVGIEGWPGSLLLEVKDYELRGRGLGGELSSERGEGDVELAEIGGKVDLRSESGRLVLQEVLGRAEISIDAGDLSLTGAEQGVKVRLARGELVLREIARRADLSVEEATLVLGPVTGAVGGTLRWVEATLQDVKGSLNLTVEEGSLTVRGVQAGLVVRATDAPLGLEDLGGAAQVDARGPFPVKIKNAARGLKMNLEESEAEVAGVTRGLTVVQRGGSLVAREIGGEPDVRVDEVALEYTARGSVLKGGRFVVNGGRARLRLPRRSTLAVSGDDDRVSGSMNRRLLDDLDEEELERGHYVELEVNGADVQVTGA
jgi:hypothetical protein